MRWVLIVAAVALVGCTKPLEPTPLADTKPAVPANRVQELLAKLDDDPDILHADYTPAVWELIEIGEPVIEPTLPYLLSENETTRLHAERVIEGVMRRMYGFVAGKGWTRPGGEQEFRQLSNTLWDFEARGGKSVYESPVRDRLAYILRVKRWLTSLRV